jgi:hypothetical protein
LVDSFDQSLVLAPTLKLMGRGGGFVDPVQGGSRPLSQSGGFAGRDVIFGRRRARRDEVCVGYADSRRWKGSRLCGGAWEVILRVASAG